MEREPSIATAFRSLDGLAGFRRGARQVLGVSWLNGRFCAVANSRTGEEQTFSGEIDPQRPEQLRELLRRAVEHTGYPGRDVAVVLAHPQLLQFQVDSPPAEGAVLRAFIGAQVERLKNFEGPAIWANQSPGRSKGSRDLQIHVAPQMLLDQLDDACSGAGLRLIALVPVLGLMAEHLAGLPAPAGSSAILTADFGGLTSVLLGQTDGRVSICRTIGAGWQTQTERLLTDLRRTLLFAGQQSDSPVAGIWDFGGEVPEGLRAMANGLKLRAEAMPSAMERSYWARHLSARRRFPLNLIPEDRLHASRRRGIRRMTGWTALLLAISTLLASHRIQIILREQRAALFQLRTSILNLQGARRERLRLQAELELDRQHLQAVQDRKSPPVAAWFQAHLADVCPSDIRLTSSTILMTNGVWRFNLEGRATAGVEDSARFTNAFRQLTAGLTRPPLSAIVESESFSGPQSAGPGHLGERDRRRRGGALQGMPSAKDRADGGGSPLDMNFAVEGRIE